MQLVSVFEAIKYIILLSFCELQICIFLILDLNLHPHFHKICMKRKMKKQKIEFVGMWFYIDGGKVWKCVG